MTAALLKNIYLLLLLCACVRPAAAQSPVYAVDTGFHADTACVFRLLPYWYAKGKYPEKSGRLVALANEALKDAAPVAMSGYITFRFLVNCKGECTAFRLLQTDMEYRPVLFPAAPVDQLYLFVRSLKGWPPAVYKGEPNYYKAYLSFKIRNGHVVEVSP